MDPMRQYVDEQVRTRLGRLVFEVHRCAKSREVEAVHDLRVAIRRFNQSLRTFLSLLPRREAVRVRKRTRRLMRQSAEIRNRDIALQFLARGGFPQRSTLRSRLERERRQAETLLAEMLQRFTKKDYSARWRAALELNHS